MEKIFTTIIICILALSFVGCGPNGKLYKKSYVLRRVSNTVPSEKYKFVKKEPVPDASASTEIYYFESLERDLQFRAVNTRLPAFFESGLYARNIQVKYTEDVHSLYENDLYKTLENYGYSFKKKRFYIYSFDDLKRVADGIAKADDIYKNELNYNSAEWLYENPAMRCPITLKKENQSGKEDIYEIGGIYINGTWENKMLYDYICYKYASCVADGKFEDETIPEKVMKTAHVTTLDHVYINDIEVSKTAYEKSKENGTYNNSDYSYYAEYCYKLNDYVIPYNPATVGKECGPNPVEGYLDILAPGYEVEYRKGKIKWDYNGSHFESNASEGRQGYINSFIIYKDGKDINIPYITCGEWSSPVRGVYMVGITATDFANLFNMTVEIDEENGCLYIK